MNRIEIPLSLMTALMVVSIANSSYARKPIREVPQAVEYGVVMEAFPYNTDGPHTGRGRALGASVGLATQTQAVWGGLIIEDPMAAVLATAAGGVVGMKVEKAMNSEKLVQIHVLLENGKEEVITQPTHGTKFKSLDEVKILRYSNRRNRVFLRDAKVEFETNPYE